MSLKADLERRVLANDASRGWTRALFTPEHYADTPPLTPGRSIITTYGARDATKKTTYVRPEHWPVAALELAHMYLTTCRAAASEEASGGKRLVRAVPYRKPLPFPWCDGYAPAGPSFMATPRDEPYVAADFTACFARLYLGTTADCYYRLADRVFTSGRIEWWRRDEWLTMKDPRNRAWGLMCAAPQKDSRRSRSSPHFAPFNTSFSMHCLAAIAHTARENFGACYWRGNDEVWLPKSAFDAFAAWCRETWRMELHNVRDVSPNGRGKPFDNTYPLTLSERSWLADTWRWSDGNRAGAQLSGRVRTAGTTRSRTRDDVLQVPPDTGSAA